MVVDIITHIIIVNYSLPLFFLEYPFNLYPAQQNAISAKYSNHASL